MKMRAPVATALAISFGLLVLLGYFIPPDAGALGFLLIIRSILVGWAVILAGIAALVGVLNLFGVHWRRMTAKRTPDRYSILVVVAFIATLAAGLYLTPANVQFQQVVLSIQMPIEAALMGVLAVTLTFASLRLFQRRKGIMAVVFAVSAVIFLVIGSGLLSSLQNVPLVSDLVGFVQRIPVAGGRGILLGIALGSLTAGLRVLLGADRPYSG